MQVIANGRSLEVTESATVADVLNALGLAGRVVVVERNGEPVDRSLVASVRVDAGDRLEIVRAVAGG
jgi:sulfur carrier protein